MSYYPDSKTGLNNDIQTLSNSNDTGILVDMSVDVFPDTGLSSIHYLFRW